MAKERSGSVRNESRPPRNRGEKSIMNAGNLTKVLVVSASVVALFVFMFCATSLWENLDAGQIMVIQSPLSGSLTTYITPGVKWQGFGKVTKYQKRSEFWFSNKSDQGKSLDQSLRIRFNDGAHALISGGISFEVPLEEEKLIDLHTKFGSQESIEQSLVRKSVEKGIYMTGPHMSSKESYAELRNDLLFLIDDQIGNGVYLTKTSQEKTKDPITGEERTVSKVDIVKNTDGAAQRAEESPLKEFGIKVFNLAINEIKYDENVETQIQEQQKAIMQVQLAMAKAKEAEQRALTTKKEGEASAAKAEWDQKTLMATAVTEAEQKKKVAALAAEMKLEVAKLETQAAEQKKLADIALGEGEAKRRTLVMEADGALEKKLEAYVAVNNSYAEAIAKHQGNWVPSVVMGQGAAGQANGNAATDLISLLMAKTAKDLSMDLNTTTPVKK